MSLSADTSVRNQPIGVFDSGVGGLTVVSAIQRLLPHEDIVYLGDTARVPYGNKSPETIIRYAQQDVQFLQSQNVKAVVIACNTATAQALSVVRERYPFPVLGVIEPGVQAALSATTSGRIGIIGTVGTIQSGAYQKALLAKRPELQITARATPLLVSLVEEDWLNHAATHLILAEYLAPLQSARIDTLVLACTHYPLLKGIIGTILHEGVRLVDSAENMALNLRERLQQDNLLREEEAHNGRVRIHVTDLSSQFVPLAKRFLGSRIGAIDQVQL
jgi:glutamate racemase